MTLCRICSWLRHILQDALLRFYLERCIPKQLKILTEGKEMAAITVSVGKTAAFTVVAFNAQVPPQPVPDNTITSSTDNTAVATATVNSDGTNGVVTGVTVGTCNLNATDGTLNATPVVVTVVDLTPATLQIIPS